MEYVTKRSSNSLEKEFKFKLKKIYHLVKWQGNAGICNKVYEKPMHLGNKNKLNQCAWLEQEVLRNMAYFMKLKRRLR